MSSSKKNKGEPELDPYDVLGVEFGVSDAVITKAYRKNALALHPDKQTNLTAQEAERVALEFHNVKEARAFLLDAEYREARTKYDAKRASIQRRRQAEKEREMNMSERRKRLREELKQKEEEAAAGSKRAKTSPWKSKSKHDGEFIHKLRREGGNMRQAFAEKEAEAAAETMKRQAKQEVKLRKEKERLLEDRQIRLKWSRKKMKSSPSEDSIATMLSRFGSVQEVEMLGSKGNLALVTFADSSSCRPCVEAYKNSEVMRASYVGKRKEDEELREAAGDREEQAAFTILGSRDKESLYDRKLRQEAERDRLRWKLEEEDESGSVRSESWPKQSTAAEEPSTSGTSTVSVYFPSTADYKNLSPLQKLEKAEQDILGGILPPEILARLKPVA